MPRAAHTPPNPRNGGRALTAEELEARAFAFDVAVAAQLLACEKAERGYLYAEHRARGLTIAALEFLDSLDQLVGHSQTEVP